MIISDEQVQRALEYLHTADTNTASATALASIERPTDELVARVRAVLSSLPDVRSDRIAEAQHLLATSIPTSEEVAGKLLGRLISDAVR